MTVTFDSVPISAVFGAKSVTESIERVREVVCVVNEKPHVRDLLFLAERTEKQHGELRRSRLRQPNVEDLIRARIDRREQPVTLAVDANQCPVDRNLIQVDVAVGLSIGLPRPVVDRGTASLDAQLLKMLFGI